MFLSRSNVARKAAACLYAFILFCADREAAGMVIHMKRIVICSVPMKANVDLSVYTSDDQSLPVSDRKVRYPINAFLEKVLQKGEELKVLLLTKKDRCSHSEQNTENFKAELTAAAAGSGAEIEYAVIDTDFAQTRAVYEQLMGKIIDEVEQRAHILADTTYGPKDLPVILFTALHFAEKFLDCKIDNILYGQASFVDGHAVDAKICDMTPLYYLSSITNLIHCDEPDRARAMLKSFLSL